MSKINNKSIILSLKILSFLAFCLLIVPVSVSAERPGYVTPYNPASNNQYTYPAPTPDNPMPVINAINPSSSNIGVGTKTITITGSGFVPGSIAKINGSNRFTNFIDSSRLLVQTNNSDLSNVSGFYVTVFNGAPGGGYSNAVFFTVKVASASNTNNTSGNVSPASDTFSETPSYGNTTSDSGSNLASNAIFGSNSFLPSGLIQWVLFAIVILLIVIAVRKIFGAKQEYEETPLKHA